MDVRADREQGEAVGGDDFDAAEGFEFGDDAAKADAAEFGDVDAGGFGGEVGARAEVEIERDTDGERDGVVEGVLVAGPAIDGALVARPLGEGQFWPRIASSFSIRAVRANPRGVR